jgi:hypothetical protein
MPMQVRIALGLLGAKVLYGLFGVYGSVQVLSAMSAMPNMPALPAGVGYMMIGSAVGKFALQALFTAGLVWRKNWARIGWLVLTLMGLAGLIFMAQSTPNTVQPPTSVVILDNVVLVISIVATYLLFSAGGKAWFRRDEPEHV